MEIKSFVAEGVVIKSDRTTGEIVAVANSGNIKDKQGDVMIPGCWRKVIAEAQTPAVCWAHDLSDIRGKVLSLEEVPPGDPRMPLNRNGGKDQGSVSGLLFRAQMAMETESGRDAFALLKGGFIKQFSVQFSIAEDGEEVTGVRSRNVKLVDQLYEISPVLVGASPGTTLLAAKALDMVALLKGDAKPEPRELAQAIHDLATSMEATCPEMDLDKAFGLIESALQSEKASQTAVTTLDFEAIGKEFELPGARVATMLQASQDTKAKFQMSDGKFPIDNCSDVSDAWKLRGRSTNWSSAQVARMVQGAARALNCSGPWNGAGKTEEIEKHDKPGRARLQKMHDSARIVHAEAAALGALCACNVIEDAEEKTNPVETGKAENPSHVFDFASLLGLARATGDVVARKTIER